MIIIIFIIAFEYFLMCINYVYNSRLNKLSGFIENQHKGTASNYRIGLFASKHNGCGWIACRNVLHLLSQKRSISWIIFFLEFCFGPVLFGIFGINPLAIALLLMCCNCNVSIKRPKYNVDKSASNVGILLCFARRMHAHYTAFERKGDEFIIHNPHIKTKSLDAYISERKLKFALLINVSPKVRIY